MRAVRSPAGAIGSSAQPTRFSRSVSRSAGQGGVLDATQRVPREAMLYAYTRNAAHALNQLDEIGSLAPGKRADMILVDRDVLTVPVADLNDAKVVWTMFAGNIVSGQAP